MALPLNKRYEIVFLHEHEADPKWGYEKIASHIHCSQSCKTTKAQDERIVKLAMKKHDITAAEIQQKLDKQGVEISKTTIRRRLDESGGKFIKEISKPLLSEGHMVKRLQWAKKHKKFDWKRVIFTDENTFQLFQSNRKIWQFAGRRKVFCMVKHPQKVHVWGCFSAQGFGKLICFEQNLNAIFMCNIYEKGLLPSACEFFGEDSINWILQEDNDPKHRSKSYRKCLATSKN
ncbi:IS630 family transposase [Rhizophagus irregularis DAOM 181602=DAOM 197198]|nr:IS630 family transposase [Rhizophagus irregularis DAOM 181602=DAOM 197198]